MTTALDTNVLVALRDERDTLNALAAAAIERAAEGRMVVCGPVYAELVAMPGRTEGYVQRLLDDLTIDVEWEISEPIWRTAAQAFAKYASRRRKGKSGHPRRILTDFMIGSHAFENGYSLLTFDDKLFRAAFPKLRIIRV